MITANPSTQTVTIVLEHTDIENLVNMQSALFELIREYNFKDYGSIAAETVFYATHLLQAITPGLEQQMKAFTDNINYLPLPEQITPEQKQAIHSLLMNVKCPGQKVDPAKVLQPFLNVI